MCDVTLPLHSVRTNAYFVFERKYNYEAKLLAAIILSDFSYAHSHREGCQFVMIPNSNLSLYLQLDEFAVKALKNSQKMQHS